MSVLKGILLLAVILPDASKQVAPGNKVQSPCDHKGVHSLNKRSLLLYMDFEEDTFNKTKTRKFKSQRFINVKASDAGRCARGANLTDGHIELIPSRQPKVNDITVALWIKLDVVSGKQTLVRLLGRETGEEKTRFTLEVHEGMVKWGCWVKKDKLFLAKTQAVVEARLWTHVMSTFSTRSLNAAIYINQDLVAQATMRKVRFTAFPLTWIRKIEIGSPSKRRRLKGIIDELYVRRRDKLPSPTTPVTADVITTPHQTQGRVTRALDASLVEQGASEYELRCYVCKAFNKTNPRDYCSPDGGHATKTICQGVTPLKCIEHTGIHEGTSFFIRDCKEESFCEARSCTGELCTMKCCESDFCNRASHRETAPLQLILTLFLLNFVLRTTI
ncbi:uncharacterized protein LOC116610737 isoform X2 [Nematostella vectensis]|uniref:uncharacterized protein LOC116610737 isoform X2 n=1 Tax=Nematostella vectensis TaxID=45351 RepID=UPI00207793FF|nr:uncharacterized protein LOC116610737 isoform X2 [Nematostella vectensis]